jgi:class 3 adenylate cyclase
MEDVAVYCALVALSGGLRLWPASAAFSTVAALLAFIGLTTASQDSFGLHAQTLIAITIAGLFGYRLTTIVRTSLDGEVSRTIFRRFLPEHLVEQARHDPLGAIGEPHVIDATVLFTDLRNFTGLVETMPPGQVLDYLNDVQGLLASIVAKHGGTVDKFLGDGMLAVFGAPRHMEHHAQLGIAAATEIISSIAALNRERRGRGEPAAEIGLGLHTGSVIAGCVGSGARLEFTVLGDAVNATSRLEGLTKEMGVTALVSEETVRQAGSEPRGMRDSLLGRLTRRGEVAIRGRIAPLSVYSLEGVPA